MTRKGQKTTKRLIALLLTASMCFGAGAPASATSVVYAGNEIEVVKARELHTETDIEWKEENIEQDLSSDSENESTLSDEKDGSDDEKENLSRDKDFPEEEEDDENESGGDSSQENSSEEESEEETPDTGGTEEPDNGDEQEPELFIFDFQPETAADVQMAIDTFLATGKKPVWEFAVEPELIPPGYVCETEEDEATDTVYWTILLLPAMAQEVTEVGSFAELSAALLDSSRDPEAVIYLKNDITASGSIGSSSGPYITKDFIIDGNGYTLNMGSCQFFLGGTPGAVRAMTVRNINLQQTTSGASQNALYGLFCIAQGGSVNNAATRGLDYKWNAHFEDMTFRGTALVGTYDNWNTAYADGVERKFVQASFKNSDLNIGCGYRAHNAVVYAENINIAGMFNMTTIKGDSTGGTGANTHTYQGFFKAPGTGKDAESFDSAGDQAAHGTFTVETGAEVYIERAASRGTDSNTDGNARYYRTLISNYKNYLFESDSRFYATAGTNRATSTSNRNAIIRSNNAGSFVVKERAYVNLETGFQNTGSATTNQRKGYTALLLKRIEGDTKIIIDGTLDITGGNRGSDRDARNTAPVVLTGPGASETRVTGIFTITSNTPNAWYYEYRTSRSGKQTFIVDGSTAEVRLLGNNNGVKGTNEYAAFEAYGDYDVDIQVLNGAKMDVESKGYRGMSLAGAGKYPKKEIKVEGEGSRLDIAGHVWAIAAETQPILSITASQGGVINLTSEGSGSGYDKLAASTVYSVGPTTYTSTGTDSRGQGSEINIIHRSGGYGAVFHDGYGPLVIDITEGGKMYVENHNSGDRDSRRAAICAQNTHAGKMGSDTGNQITVSDPGSKLEVVNHNLSIHSGTYGVNQFATGAIQIGGYATGDYQNTMTGNILVKDGADFIAVSSSLSPTVYLQNGKLTLNNPGTFEIRNDSTLTSGNNYDNRNKKPYSNTANDHTTVGQILWNGRAYGNDTRLGRYKFVDKTAVEFINCDVTVWEVMKNDPSYSGGGYKEEQINTIWKNVSFSATNGSLAATGTKGEAVTETKKVLNVWDAEDSQFALSAYGRINGTGTGYRDKGAFEVEKTSDRKKPTRVGDIVTYTIKVKNSGTALIYDVKVQDQLSEYVDFIPGTVQIDGRDAGEDAYELKDGVLLVVLGNMPQGKEIAVSFQVKIGDNAAGKNIRNTGKVTGHGDENHGEEPDIEEEIDDENDDEVEDKLSVSLEALKTSDRNSAKKPVTHVGDLVTYQIDVQKKGQGAVYDAVVCDELPHGVKLVRNSVKLNGYETAYQITDGVLEVPLGNLTGSATVSVTFKVIVTAEAEGKSIQNSGVVEGYSQNEEDRAEDAKPDVETTFTDGNDIEVEKAPGALLAAEKTSDRKDPTRVGDTVTYKITVKNSGKAPAYHVTVNDDLTEHVEFVADSVKINETTAASGTDYTVDSNGLHVTLGTLPAKGETVIVFQVKVSESAEGKSIENIGDVTGRSNEDDSEDDLYDEFTDDNNGMVEEELPVRLDVKKTSDRQNPTRTGDYVSYTITVTNEGKGTAYDVTVYDQLSGHVELVEDSVKMENEPKGFTLENSKLKIEVGNLAAGASAKVTFQVKVKDDAVGKSIENVGNVTAYCEDENDREEGAEPDMDEDFTDGNENLVEEELLAKLHALKTSDRSADNSEPTRVGDTVSYVITVANSGTMPVYDVQVTDRLPAGVALVKDSVKLGAETTGYTLKDGVLLVKLGDLAVGSVEKTVTFQVKVTSKATGEIIENTGTASGYSREEENRQPEDEPDVEIEFTDNNRYLVEEAEGPVLEAEKTSNRKTVTRVGDTVIYTITVKNAGTKPACDVALADLLPEHVGLVEDSVRITGDINNPTPEYTVVNSILKVTVGDLDNGAEAAVSFWVTVKDGAEGETIRNTGTATGFSERTQNGPPDLAAPFDDENEGVVEGELKVKLEAEKTSDRKEAAGQPTHVGDTVTYTINVQNTGTETAYGVTVNDLLPYGVKLLRNSVQIDGSPAEYTLDGNVLRVPLPNMEDGDSTSVTFRVKVSSDAVNKAIENTGTVTAYADEDFDPETEPQIEAPFSDHNKIFIHPTEGIALEAEKSSNRSAPTRVGDIITYTVKVSNPGAETVYDVLMEDQLPQGVVFLANSVTVAGEAAGYSIEDGLLQVPVGNIEKAGEPVMVNFQVEVDGGALGSAIENTGVVTGFDDEGKSRDHGDMPDAEDEFSDNNKDLVEAELPVKLAVEKSSDRNDTQVGDTIKYTISVENVRAGTAYGVTVKDYLPEGVKLVPGTVMAGGVAASPEQFAVTDETLQVSLQDLDSGQPAEITFEVKVTEGAAGKTIENTGIATAYLNPGYDPEAAPDLTVQFSDNNHVRIPQTSGGTPLLEAEKTSDRGSATYIGDIVTYTISVKNTGTATVHDVLLNDILPDGVQLVNSSVKVNGSPVAYSVKDSVLQVGLHDLAEGSSAAVVTFQVKVRAAAEGKIIENTGTVSGFSEAGQDRETEEPDVSDQFSDWNKVKVEGAAGPVLEADKTSDRHENGQPTRVGDTVTYTITVRNTGGLPADNVMIKDTLAYGVEFVEGSVKVNGSLAETSAVEVTDENVLQVILGTVEAGQTVIVSFQVKVLEEAKGSSIRNTGLITGDDTEEEEIDDEDDEEVEEKLPVILEAEKTSDRSVPTRVGDLVSYTISVKNSGSGTAYDVTVNDKLAEGVKLIEGSVKAGGKTAQYIVSDNGVLQIYLGELASDKTVDVTFQVKVLKEAKGQSIENVGTVTAYEKHEEERDPEDEPVEEEFTDGDENLVEEALIAVLEAIKTSDRSVPTRVGDTVTYRILVDNVGEGTVYDTVLFDHLPQHTRLVAGSVKVDGNPTEYSFSDGILQIELHDITAYGSYGEEVVVEVEFQAKVDAGAEGQSIENTGMVQGYSNSRENRSEDAEPDLKDDFTDRNTVLVEAVDSPALEAVKTSDRKIVTRVGDVVTYTIEVKNGGSMPVYDVTLKDELPAVAVDGQSVAAVALVENTVTIRGEAAGDYTVTDGVLQVMLGQMNEKDSALVTFQVVVTEAARGNAIENLGIAEGYSSQSHGSAPDVSDRFSDYNRSIVEEELPVKLTTVKESDREGVTRVGDIVTYTITVQNTGEETAYDAVVSDKLPSGVRLRRNTVTINGEAAPVGSYAIKKGVLQVPVGHLEAGQEAVTVSFKVKVYASAFGKSIENTGILTAYSQAGHNPEEMPDIKEPFSDKNKTLVGESSGKAVLEAGKRSDRKIPTRVGDTVTYTIDVTNTGTRTAANVVVHDPLAEGVAFVEGSVKIGGTAAGAGQYSLDGSGVLHVTLGEIEVEETVLVSFQVTVTEAAEGKSIRNIGTVTGDDSEEEEFDDEEDDKVETGLKVRLQAEKTSTRSSVQPTRVGDLVTYTIKVKNTGDEEAYDVTVNDQLAQGVKLISGSVAVNGTSADYTMTGRVMQVHVGNLEAGHDVSVTFQVKVTSDALDESIENVGTVTAYEEENHDSDAEPDVEEPFSDNNKEAVEEASGAALEAEKTSDRSKDEPTRVGDTVTYSISVKNSGTKTAYDVVVHDQLAKGVQLLRSSVKINGSPAYYTVEEGLLHVAVGSLAPEDGELTVTFQVKVLVEALGENIRNVGTITGYSDEDHDEDDEPDVEEDFDDGDDKEIEEAQGAVLEAEKVSDRDGITRDGDIVTYAIGVTNTGTETTYSVCVADTLPAGADFIEGTVTLGGAPTEDYEYSNGELKVFIGDLDPDNTEKIGFQAKVTPAAVGSDIENTGTASGYSNSSHDPQEKPDVKDDFSDNNKIRVRPKPPQLTAAKTSTRSESEATRVGDTITYTIKVENTGETTAYDLTVSDKLAEGVRLVRNSVEVDGQETACTVNGDILQIHIGDLEPENETYITFRVKVYSEALGKSIENMGTVTGYSESEDVRGDDGPDVEEEFTDNNKKTVEEAAGPVLEAKKTSDRKNPTRVGDVVTYHIEVKNSGKAPVYDILLKDTLADGVALIEDSVEIGSEAAAYKVVGNELQVELGGLKEDESVALTFQVTVTEQALGKNIENVGIATGYGDEEHDGEDPDVDEEFTDGNEDEVEDELNVALSAQKTSDRSAAKATKVGDVVTYTISVKNTGADPAYGVTVNDRLPADVGMVSGSMQVNGTATGYTTQNGVVHIPVGVLESSQEVVLTFQVTVLSSAEGKSIENTGTVTGHKEADEEGEPDLNIPFTDGNTSLVEGSGDGGNGGGGAGGGGGGTGGSGLRVVYHSQFTSRTISDGGHRQGDTITVRNGDIFDIPAGYQFRGWSDTAYNDYAEEDKREVIYLPGDTFQMPSGDMKLHAVYDYEMLNTDDHYAYVVGYPDGTVRPNDLITREEVTTIFFRLLTDSVRDEYWRTTNTFSDVQAGWWSNNAVSTMANGGIVSGYPDGSFRPQANITRAEVAVIAAQFSNAGYGGSDKFGDIAGHWAGSYINRAANEGWISGYTDGSFRPDEYITRAEVMTLVNQVLGRNPRSASDLLSGMVTWADNADTTAWYYLHVQEATNSHYYEKDQNGYEWWTSLRPTRNWAELEQR